MCDVCDGRVPFPEGPPTVEEAIRTVEHSRHVHIEWADYIDAHPDFDPGPVGNARFHLACVTRYSRVLEVLRRHEDRV